MASMQTLTTDRLTLRPAHVEDLPDFLRIIQAPGTAEWWGHYEGQEDDDELVGGFAIVLEGETIGWLGSIEETATKYPSVAFDIMIDPAHQAKGYGPEALRALIDHYIAKGHHRFTIDPSTKNKNAIRAYEKVGFKAIGVERDSEIFPDGTFGDGLLMDLLARELDA
jgi:aminoglycoside 6'-N-acetyltransferase